MNWLAILNFLKPLAPWIGAAGLGAVVLAFGIHLKSQYDMVPNLQSQVKELQAQYKGAVAAYTNEVAAFNKSENLRASDQQQARVALSQSAAECEARLIEVRRATCAIKDISHGPIKYDKNNCPVHALLDSSQLRNALGASSH